MTLSSFRGLLYSAAKSLGDVQAVAKAAKTGSLKPIAKRIGRRLAGRSTASVLSWLFR
jgi:uncharacterized membrane protein YoaK (UPF0700 family)